MARILVIDDESVVRQFVRTILERAGYEVEEAASGDEGLSANRKQPCDVALVDLLMPAKNGVTTIGELRADRPHTAIVAMTGAPPVNWPLRELYELPGTMRMLVKPVSAQMLLDTVAESLETLKLNS